MANTYTWGVNNMVSYPQAEGLMNVVTTVNWVCNGTDGTYSGALTGSTPVRLNADAPYTPYNELTEQQVISWVWETIGQDQVTSIQNDVAAQIANNYYVPTILPNPWS